MVEVTPRQRISGPTVGRTRRWSLNHSLALAGVPVLFWWIWTVVAWLSDNPHQITEFRTPHSANWWAARVVEGLIIAVCVPVVVYLVRQFMRERRFTFDAMFCLVLFTGINADVGPNVFQPVLLVSSNFVNVNAMCGHIPLIVYPDCGRGPDPLLAWWPVVAFLILGIALVSERPVRWARSRWPGISNLKIIGLFFLVGAVIDLAWEIPAISLGLWSYTAPLHLSIPLFGNRYAIPELICGMSYFALLPALAIFRDDRGRTFCERGLDHLPRKQAMAITALSLFFLVQVISWIPVAVPDMLYGPYMSQWPKTPRVLVNDVCDAPGITGTRYGPCPGSPGYRMPGRHSLPGRSP